MNKVTISIANNFSAYPAGRYPADGEYNATAFRKEWLLPALTDNARVSGYVRRRGRARGPRSWTKHSVASSATKA